MRLQDVSYCFVLHVMILLRAEIRLTSWYGRYPIIYRVFSTIPGGSPDFSHQQYDLPFGKARPSVALSEEGLRRKATYIHKLESILAWNFTRTPWRIHGKMVYLHEWLIFFGNLGEYTIHWWYGKWIQPESYEHDDLFFGECKFPCWLMRGRTLPVQFFLQGFGWESSWITWANPTTNVTLATPQRFQGIFNAVDESQDGLLSEEELFLGHILGVSRFGWRRVNPTTHWKKTTWGGLGNPTSVSIENEFLSKHLALCCRLAVIEFDEMRCCRQRSW